MEIKTLKAGQKTKKTAIGEIPVDWEAVELQNVIKDIGDGGTPDTRIAEYFNGGIPWATVADIKFRIRATRQTISELGLKNSSAKLWPPQTVILTTGATIGKVGLAEFPLATKQGITGIICNESRLIPEYLARFFETKEIFLNRIAQGGTFKEVRAPILKRLELALPPLSEQKKIAEILASVDAVIDQTRAVIDQTKTVKKGLMQELLTRGIPGRHKKFKKTELGMIPEEWSIARIKDIGEIVTGNTPSTKASRYYNGDYPWATPGDLGIGKYVKTTLKMLSGEGAFVSRFIPKNSILVVCIGSTIGKIGMASQEMSTNQQINSIVCNKDWDYHFVYYWMSRIAKLLVEMAGKHAVPIINKTGFSVMPVLKVPIDEQRAIGKILDSIDIQIHNEEVFINNLGYLKSALMQVLLTGEVRVKV
mgnify:CR=1 FL=1